MEAVLAVVAFVVLERAGADHHPVEFPSQDVSCSLERRRPSSEHGSQRFRQHRKPSDRRHRGHDDGH